ncbi:lysophospholipid acyltransferase family protein [Streptomyces albulus]|nr:lysophospholipid acyltransferase family protein [Streptomyces noursei]
MPGPGAGAHPGTLIVLNHISWLDIVALLAVEPAVLLAKREVGGWPLVGGLAQRAGTHFIDRTHPRRLPRTVAELSALLAAGRSVAVFPRPPPGAPPTRAASAGPPSRPRWTPAPRPPGHRRLRPAGAPHHGGRLLRRRHLRRVAAPGRRRPRTGRTGHRPSGVADRRARPGPARPGGRRRAGGARRHPAVARHLAAAERRPGADRAGQALGTYL